MDSVSAVLNESHLSTNSTLGAPGNVEVYGQALTPSVNFSTAYAFQSIEDLGHYHESKFNSVRYARDSSVLVKQMEGYFELMHSGSPALLFNSGMAAVSACLNVVARADTVVVTSGEFYRKSLSIITALVARWGLRHEHVSSMPDFQLAGVTDERLLFFVESPSNPFLRLTDVNEIKAYHPGSTVVLDTTLQGLLNSKNGFAGADLLISSCTKYIGGHNDVLGGLVVARDERRFPALWEERSMRGGIMENLSAYLLLRSLRTYDIRIEKTLANLEQVLDFLGASERVESIYYPGRYSNADQRDLVSQELRHGGGLVTFKVTSDTDLIRNVRTLCSTKMAPSFGSVDSLVELPMYMSHWGKCAEELESMGLDKYTVRFSVGNEPVEYILGDLGRLLSAD